VVDTLDFPLDPPDGNDANGGRDFGRYRSRYDKYHAGEDWWGRSRRSTLGMPVYSIGHGTVTYAEPLGWGADQGVVIVRHVFTDGKTVLSFYGHLDPKSIELAVGDCVARGDRVGKVGKPRSPPHLHLEIRTHMPAEPGGGYWPVDPTRAGWKPPSAYIWQYRIATAPGVQWMRTAEHGGVGLGMLDQDTFVAVQDGQLIGIDVRDGSVRWRRRGSVNAYNALLDRDRSTIYTTSLFGVVEAFRLSSAGEGKATTATESPLESLWKIKLDTGGFPMLMPHPGGGVIVSTRRKMSGVSAHGLRLWERDAPTRISDWALTDDRLILATTGGDGSIWTVYRSGPQVWDTQVGSMGSRLAIVGDQIWAYDWQGIYRLDPESRTAELLYALHGGFPPYGDIVALPDGGALVAHWDNTGGGLIALRQDGTLRWRRSYDDQLRGQKHFLMSGDRAYLVSQFHNSSLSETTLLEIDIENAELVRVFAGGSRNPVPADTWTFAISDDRVLINVGGSGTLALDTRLAWDAVRPGN
jgi:hypothetical protein